MARILTGQVVATSRMSEVEVASALARRFREGTLARRDMERALAALHADLRSIALVEMVAEVVELAVALLGRHPLRAGDSLQLGSCLRRQLTDELLLLASRGITVSAWATRTDDIVEPYEDDG